VQCCSTICFRRLVATAHEKIIADHCGQSKGKSRVRASPRTQGNVNDWKSLSVKLALMCRLACHQRRCSAAPVGFREGKEFLQKAPPTRLGPVRWRPVRRVRSAVLDLSDWPDFLWYLQVINFLNDIFRPRPALEGTDGIFHQPAFLITELLPISLPPREFFRPLLAWLRSPTSVRSVAGEFHIAPDCLGQLCVHLIRNRHHIR
jgi:hypothetical protein